MAIVVPGHTAATEGCPELYPEHRRRVAEWAPGGSCTPRCFLFCAQSLVKAIEERLLTKDLIPQVSD